MIDAFLYFKLSSPPSRLLYPFLAPIYPSLRNRIQRWSQFKLAMELVQVPLELRFAFSRCSHTSSDVVRQGFVRS